MEMNFGPINVQLASNMKRGGQKSQYSELEVPQHHEENGFSSPLSLRNLSKLILPPLGSSSFNQSQIESKGWIISPMDSRYR
jgi:hypothetical protein